MNPTDKTGQLRCRIKEELGLEYPNGKKFSESELEELLRFVE